MNIKWIKLWVNESLDGSIRKELDSAGRGYWYDTLLLAATGKRPGYLERKIGLPLTDEEIISRLNISRELFDKVTPQFLDEGRLARDKEGTYIVTNWSNYQSVLDGNKGQEGNPIEQEKKERRLLYYYGRKYPQDTKALYQQLNEEEIRHQKNEEL